VSLIRNTHARVLNRLESQAVEMALRERPLSENDPVIIRLGTESGVPFVALGRGVDEIIIHFEDEKPKVETKVEVKPDAKPAATTKPAATKPAAAKKPAAVVKKPAQTTMGIRRGGAKR